MAATHHRLAASSRASSAATRCARSGATRTAPQKYLDIERALAIVQARLGLIPQEAADEIVSHCQLDQIDMDKLRAADRAHRLPDPRRRVADSTQLCRDKLGEYCHWGATTQDITDTATVLQIREALALVDAELAAIAQGAGQAGQRTPR